MVFIGIVFGLTALLGLITIIAEAIKEINK